MKRAFEDYLVKIKDNGQIRRLDNIIETEENGYGVKIVPRDRFEDIHYLEDEVIVYKAVDNSLEEIIREVVDSANYVSNNFKPAIVKLHELLEMGSENFFRGVKSFGNHHGFEYGENGEGGWFDCENLEEEIREDLVLHTSTNEYFRVTRKRSFDETGYVARVIDIVSVPTSEIFL